jgi:hypothetical protein
VKELTGRGVVVDFVKEQLILEAKLNESLREQIDLRNS